MPIGFWQYFRVGAPQTVLTILIGMWWLCPMIFTSESGLTDPGRRDEWDAWYRGHLAAMVAVPGTSSAQRFRALDGGPPPSLAMYSVAAPEVFDSDIYRRTRGMGPFVAIVDERLHRRNLFAGLDAAPVVAMTGFLLVAHRDAAGPHQHGLVCLRAVGLDRSTTYRGIAVLPDLAAGRAMAERVGAAALYAPMTERFEARKAG